MDLEVILQEIGLNKKETKVYLALLQLGQETAFCIAKKSALKRPTVYVVLEKLKNMGLVSITKTKKTTLFNPVEPDKIYDRFKEKEVKLKKMLPALKALYNLSPQKPKMEFFEGIEGIKNIYNETIKYLDKGEVLWFGTLKYDEPAFMEALDLWKNAIRQNKKAHARELLNDTEIERLYIKEMMDISDRYPIRLIPNNLGKTLSDFVIFDNKVFLISIKREISATVIEDEQIASAFKIFYEMAWKAGK